MRIMLASAHPYLPEIAGGAQSSMHEMALALIARGHQVAVMCGLAGTGFAGLRRRVELKLRRSDAVCGDELGYPVFRSWYADRGVADAVAAFRPDVAVPHSGLPVKMAEAFEKEGVPTIIYFRNVETDDFGGDPGALANDAIANSRFTAERLANDHDIDAKVVPPLFDETRYRTTRRGTHVTFLNPHPKKGRDLAFAIARECPDLPFLIVRAWTLDDADEEALVDLDRSCPNVTVLPTTDDMRSIYARTRVLLAPSQWEEAWGRIASEAHFSGIPVIASRIGGLPESVGPGGILLPPDAPLQHWVTALRSLMDDETRYRAMSVAARRYSERPELDPDTQLDEFVTILEDVQNSAETDYEPAPA